MFGFLRLRFRVKVLLAGLLLFIVQAVLQRLGVGEPWSILILAAVAAGEFMYLVSRFW